MKEYTVNVAVRVWIDKTIRAESEEKAREKVLRQAQELMNCNGFYWMSGDVEVAGSLNNSLLNKISM